MLNRLIDSRRHTKELDQVVTAQETTDNEQIRLLSIFHYVVGGLTAVTSSVGLFHFGMGLAIVLGLLPPTDSSPPIWFGWLFTLIGAFIVLSGWTIGALTIYSGRCLQQRKRRTLSMVMAGLNCLSFPFGTALGVFTIIVLQRPTVKAVYEGDSRWSPPASAVHAEQLALSLEELESEEEARWKKLEEEANQSKLSGGSERINIQEKQHEL